MNCSIIVKLVDYIIDVEGILIIGLFNFEIFEILGYFLGSIFYYIKEVNVVFLGDVLF